VAYIFDEFFASGRAETISPFLTPSSRKWGRNLPLFGALTAAVFLILSFAFSFTHINLSHLFLVFTYFLVGTPALIGALKDLRNLEINIDVLMTLAALLSVVIGSGMEGALLLVLFEFSAAMENAVTQKTKGALLALRQISPKMAAIVAEDGTIIERSVREIPVGTSILIRAGEVVPLDGKVTGGSSFVNLVHLTGESEPIAKREGDEVSAGAYNLDGTLTLSVTHVSADSTLTKIIDLITRAQEAKPRIERFLDRFGKWYASSIILLSLFFALTLPYFFGLPYLGEEGAIYRALAFLIAASPCALIIATPTAYLSAVSSCARKGILLKGGAILDALARCKIAAFDKTGTLTTGKLTCAEVEPIFGDISVETALSVAAGLEQGAVHPIATAILKRASERKVPMAKIEHFRSVPGFGLQGEIEGTKAFIGHPDFILPRLSEEARRALEEKAPPSQSALLLFGEALFLFHFEDEIRPESYDALPRLRDSCDMELALLTGDHTLTATRVAKALKIDILYHDLRPADKLDKIAELSQKGDLLMVGDGVNDAPALARANVGISMGKIGSSTAVEASDVVFLSDEIDRLDWLILHARKAMRIVRQNLGLALIVICFATTPALLGWVPLWLAVVLHEGGTVLVGLNSLRLLK